VRILDDGPGYPVHMLGRIGDPFLRHRKTGAARDNRQSYEGMGLGVFIAKTLLERTGAELSFANGYDPQQRPAAKATPRGAIVEIQWPRAAVEQITAALGENRAMKI